MSIFTRWSEEYAAAWQQSEVHFGEDLCSAEAVARRVAKVIPGTTAEDVEDLRLIDDPNHPTACELAYVTLVALGYLPEDFGLPESCSRLSIGTLRLMVDPKTDRQSDN